MRFDPERAAIRFGCGLSPSIPAPQTADAMLSLLAGPDDMAQRFPIAGFQVAADLYLARRAALKARNKAGTEAEREAAIERLRDVSRQNFGAVAEWLSHALLRRAQAEDAFRERLVAFWTDHFTAFQPMGPLSFSQVTYAEDAIRPHVAGRFSDMLRAAMTHPLMLRFLNQARSAGPNSRAARNRGKKIGGLNENLARELLELHTLGVDGSYTQADVRQLAELLTGLSYSLEKGFQFRPALAEPGTETVLSADYGGEKARLEDVFAVLDDLARHPETARHIARKLAVHFVSDAPDEGLVAAMAARFEETEGDLVQVYAAMLDHPAAWGDAPGNVKRPIDFIGSSLRALDIVPRHMPSQNYGKTRRLFLTPLELMGQRWGRPAGPDGWPEADTDWITPQSLAARLQWGMTVPFSLMRVLPDPREFVETALGSAAPEPVRFAARAAETRAEGVGLVLASPAFQRM